VEEVCLGSVWGPNGVQNDHDVLSNYGMMDPSSCQRIARSVNRLGVWQQWEYRWPEPLPSPSYGEKRSRLGLSIERRKLPPWVPRGAHVTSGLAGWRCGRTCARAVANGPAAWRCTRTNRSPAAVISGLGWSALPITSCSQHRTVSLWLESHDHRGSSASSRPIRFESIDWRRHSVRQPGHAYQSPMRSGTMLQAPG